MTTRKNGTFFLSVVTAEDLRVGVWDPYAYRTPAEGETLAHFAVVQRLQVRAPRRLAGFRMSPLEYRHLHRGSIPVFTVEPEGMANPGNVPMIGEGELLFGTMRAYLGNVLVTPKAEWMGETAPLFFPVKSEFVQVVPKDGLLYFWWAFFQTSRFLQSLPVGSGGTRPRLDRELLLQTPVEVPEISVRERVHRELAAYAERAWRDYRRAEELLDATTR